MLCRLFILGSAVVGISGVAHASFWGPSTYEECVVEEMRGQPQAMMWTVEKVCARRFKKEVKIIFEQNLVKNWSYSSYNLSIEFDETEYAITKGEFEFSPKKCAVSKSEDFGQRQTIKFGKGEQFHLLILDPPPLCMRTLGLWGLYK